MLAFQMWGRLCAKVWPRKHWPNRVAPTRWVMGFAHASILSSRCVSWVPRGLVLEELVFWESAGLILCRFSSHLGMKKWMAELEKLDHARLHLQFAWSDPRILAALLSSIWMCQRIWSFLLLLSPSWPQAASNQQQLQHQHLWMPCPMMAPLQRSCGANTVLFEVPPNVSLVGCDT